MNIMSESVNTKCVVCMDSHTEYILSGSSLMNYSTWFSKYCLDIFSKYYINIFFYFCFYTFEIMTLQLSKSLLLWDNKYSMLSKYVMRSSKMNLKLKFLFLAFSIRVLHVFKLENPHGHLAIGSWEIAFWVIA